MNLSIGYSKDWFDKANIPYPQEDWTWEQFEETAIKLKQANGENEINKYGAMIPLHPEFIEPLALSKGGGFLSSDGKVATGFWDSEPTIATIKWLKSMVENGVIPELTGPEMGNSFEKLGSETGMVMYLAPLLSEYLKSTTQADRFGIVGLPSFSGGTKVSVPYITAMGISSSSKFPQAAWKYIYAFSLEDNEITREAFGMGLNVSKAVYDHIGSDVESYIAVSYNELKNAQKRSSMNNKDYGQVLNQYAGRWMSLFTSDEDPEQVLTPMAADIDLLLAQARNKDLNSEQP
jgi:multiple sugar transport system substrate-binding protein